VSQPIPQQFQPDAALKFTVQGNVLTSNLVPPTLTIDGYPAPAPSLGGSSVIPIRSGPHRLEVHSQWLRRYGQATLDVVIQPQSQLEVFYAPPYHQFTTGALGMAPQQRRGLGCLIGLLVGIVAIPLLIVGLGILLG
jgi:hypothetical protein